MSPHVCFRISGQQRMRQPRLLPPPVKTEYSYDRGTFRLCDHDAFDKTGLIPAPAYPDHEVPLSNEVPQLFRKDTLIAEIVCQSRYASANIYESNDPKA